MSPNKPTVTPLSDKSSVDEIRERFDKDVERFSNLETGQTAAMDAAYCLALIAETASRVTPHPTSILDIGCGAGNYTLKLLQHAPAISSITLNDLSAPMLARASERIAAVSKASITSKQADIRELALKDASYDIILAAAVLHHLREDHEWQSVFSKLYRALKPGGSLWIFDLVESDTREIRAIMRKYYGDYLRAFKDEAYRDFVFAYNEREDSPRSLSYQCALLSASGFNTVEVLHKNACFAAFGGIKAR